MSGARWNLGDFLVALRGVLGGDARPRRFVGLETGGQDYGRPDRASRARNDAGFISSRSLRGQAVRMASWRRRLPTRDVDIDASGCSFCELCANVCPTGSLLAERHDGGSLRLSLEPGRCTGCGACVALCPEKVITLAKAVEGKVDGHRTPCCCHAACFDLRDLRGTSSGGAVDGGPQSNGRLSPVVRARCERDMCRLPTRGRSLTPAGEARASAVRASTSSIHEYDATAAGKPRVVTVRATTWRSSSGDAPACKRHAARSIAQRLRHRPDRDTELHETACALVKRPRICGLRK